jgi:uncharacterized protein (DUF427 family)
MVKAIWNGAVIAESDDTVVVENNHYFPAAALNRAYVKPSGTHTTCGWKGIASYYSLVVDGKENPDACWYYPTPMAGAEAVKDRVAFWHGVQVA